MSAVAAETPVAAGPSEPYRGIEEFRFVDAPIFFGRQNEASALLRLVTIYRGVLLFGDSGAGKSSLINAGLMPMAVEDGFAPERIRVQPKAGEEFVIERIAPADDSQYLPSIFADKDDARRIGISAAEFRKRIDERCGRRAGGVRPILVFDQFEELVTLTEQRASAVYDTITATLLDLLREETLPVKLLFVFREDHYAKLSKFFARYPNLSDHSLRLEPLHVRELRTVIEGPFQGDAVTFDHALPEAVIESLVAEFTERSESDLLNLSEVQIASLRLWRDADPEKTLKTLGVRGILEAYFEDAIDAVPSRLRHAAIALLTRMVTPSNTRNVVSAEELIADLGEEEKISSAVAQEALDALEKTARVVRRARRNEVVIYEIVSEFLIPWIARQKWLARTQRETAEREKRLTRAFWGVVIALGIALLAFGVIVYRTSNKVLAQDLRATKATLESTVEQHEAYAKDSEKREKELNDAVLVAKNEARLTAANAQAAVAQAQLDLNNAIKARDEARAAQKYAEDGAHNTADNFNEMQDQINFTEANFKKMTEERDRLTATLAKEREDGKALRKDFEAAQTRVAVLDKTIAQLRSELATASASASDAAESFIGREMERVNAYLSASDSLDTLTKHMTTSACFGRLTVLSNLRVLIEAAGPRSRLVSEARSAKSEKDRVAFAEELFGDHVGQHWAPKSPAEIVLDGWNEPRFPERVLNDPSAKKQLRKRALYEILMGEKLTVEGAKQLLPMVDKFLD